MFFCPRTVDRSGVSRAEGAALVKESIRQAAISLFHRKGYFATTTGDIAEAVGIRKSTIYHHFQNKEDLLFDVLQNTMAKLRENLDATLANTVGSERRVEAAIRSHISFHIDHQQEVFIADSELRGLTEPNRSKIIAHRNEYERVFSEIIADAIRDGVFVETDVKVAAYGVLTLCTSVANWFKPEGRLNKDEVGDVYCQLILCGLKRRA